MPWNSWSVRHDWDVGRQPLCHLGDAVRRGVEHQRFAHPEFGFDGSKRPFDHRCVGRIVRCDFVGPDLGAFIVVQCPQHKAAVRRVILGLVELPQRWNQRQGPLPERCVEAKFQWIGYLRLFWK